MGKNSFYLGDVGNASKMNLILQMLAGVSIAAVAEALSLGKINFLHIFFTYLNISYLKSYILTHHLAKMSENVKKCHFSTKKSFIRLNNFQSGWNIFIPDKEECTSLQYFAESIII